MAADFESKVTDSLARIETKLDSHKEILGDHEDRIRSVEVTRNKFWGMILGFTGLSGIIDYFAHHLGRH